MKKKTKKKMQTAKAEALAKLAASAAAVPMALMQSNRAICKKLAGSAKS